MTTTWVRPFVELPAARPSAPAAGRVAVLTFHGVGEPPSDAEPGEADVWMTRDGFVEALDAVGGRRDVVLTFDDGNASDADVALPALADRELRASFFVPAGLVGRRGHLSPAALRDLAAAGMTVGSHGMRHRPWVGLDEAAAREELREARDRLEQMLGCAVRTAACPFGAYDRRSLARLRDAGYARVYTSDRGPARATAWLQPRTTLRRGDGGAAARAVVERRLGAVASVVRSAKLALKRWR